ncbi:MAG: hypothetical protein Q8M07_05070 [Prosthecobacter sp.]|nr:hypothetical protein [Prosthecobacter sp.]
MISTIIEHLSPRSRAAVDSAGYRVRRWAAAREVLGHRLLKQRLPVVLGDFLEKWGAGLPQETVPALEWRLNFGLTQDQIWLLGGPNDLPDLPLERALLHLPALRGFWRQELRQHHFDELRAIVPQAWLMDEAAVPPGAVIHGLGITAWEEWKMLKDRKTAPAVRERFLMEQLAAEIQFQAVYGSDDHGRVVLRTIEASP